MIILKQKQKRIFLYFSYFHLFQDVWGFLLEELNETDLKS